MKKQKLKITRINIRENGQGVRDKVMDAIDRYWKKNFCPPSFRDISEITGIDSLAHVAYVVKVLEQQGLIFPRRHDVSRDIIPMWVRDAIEKVEV